LSAITPAEWSFDLADQLLERAGFGGTPEEVAQLAELTPVSSRRWLYEL
jgi:hypothetical protein